MAGKSKMKSPRIRCPVNPAFWFIVNCVFFLLSLLWWKGQPRKLTEVSFIRALVSSMRILPSWPHLSLITSPKPHLLASSHWDSILTRILERHIHSVYSKRYLLFMWTAHLLFLLKARPQRPNHNLPCAWASGPGKGGFVSPAGNQATSVLCISSFISVFFASSYLILSPFSVSFPFLLNLFIVFQFLIHGL